MKHIARSSALPAFLAFCVFVLAGSTQALGGGNRLVHKREQAGRDRQGKTTTYGPGVNGGRSSLARCLWVFLWAATSVPLVVFNGDMLSTFVRDSLSNTSKYQAMDG